MSMYDAKKKMLTELKKTMMKEDGHGDLADALKGKKLQKVTVAATSPEGLKKGLSKAEEILKAKEGDMGMEEESEEEEALESPEEEKAEMEEESPEALKAEIARLKAKLGE